MQFRVLGKGGITVSQLCSGTMTFRNAASQAEASTMIHRFWDAGGNSLDTSDVCVGGRSTEIVGQAMWDRCPD